VPTSLDSISSALSTTGNSIGTFCMDQPTPFPTLLPTAIPTNVPSPQPSISLAPTPSPTSWTYGK
jgi:hypothetical protein